jgi:hypothetical protein
MPNDNRIPKVLRTVFQEAQRKRSPEEKDVARRFVLGRATIAEYLAARQHAER